MSKFAVSQPAISGPAQTAAKDMDCAVMGCTEKAQIVFTLKDGTRIARCADHYMKQIYAAGKGSMCEITGNQPTMTIDLVKEHWAKVDERERVQEEKRKAYIQ